MGAFARDYLIPIFGGDIKAYDRSYPTPNKMKIFKVIIAGSRAFKDYEMLKKKCDNILASMKDCEIWIISGTAQGADQLGERYAFERGYYLMECPAPWDDIKDKPKSEIKIDAMGRPYWIKAGHYRNQQMAEEADALIVFDLGTPGTKDMIRRAYEKNLKVREIKIR